MLGKDKIERRVKKAKITLMRKPEFALWSGIMMVGKTEVRDGFPSAATNGRDEIYGTEFVNGLDDKELMFVVLHENLHKAFRHLHIWKKLHDENAQLANMACDYVINLILHKTDPQEQTIAIPRKDGKIYGLLDTRFDGMNTKQVFDLLKQEQEEGKGQPQNGEGNETGEGFDEHDWEGAQELSQEEVKELEREVDQALRQGQMTAQKLAGKGAGNMHRELGDLLEPQVDWREVLREFVNATCNAKDASSWRRLNRRYLSMDMYMPSLIGERVGHVVIGGDTSGSIREELRIFISEMQSILDMVSPEKVDVFYWDSEIASHETYDSATLSTLAQTTQPKGGGGTDPTCVERHLNENNIKPDCIIMFTDGHIYDWGNEWNAPILWVVVGDATAPVGKTLNIKDGLE